MLLFVQSRLSNAYLKFLQIWPFHTDHLCQQLGLEAIFRDSEVEEGHLGLQFRLVVRIRQLRVKDEAEVPVELTFFIPNLDVPETVVCNRETVRTDSSQTLMQVACNFSVW